MSREAQEYLMGHAPDSNDMNAVYGSRESYRREMHKLSFVGWGLEKVQRWRPSAELTAVSAIRQRAVTIRRPAHISAKNKPM